jgi:hypothetical protein
MITVSLFISMTLILIISFILVSRKNNLLLLIFVFMCIEYLFTSFISVIVDNENLWKVSENPGQFLMFRVAEVVIFPLMLLWYLEMEKLLKTSTKRLVLKVIATLILMGIERILVMLDIMKYSKWQLWASFLTWFLLLSITIVLGKIYSRLLQKEGITN